MATHTLFGIHAVLSALRSSPEDVLDLMVDSKRADNRLRDVIAMAGSLGVSVQRVGAAALERAANGERHQGVVARCRIAAGFSEDDLLTALETATEPALLLVLDGVTDPHNLGACLRTAEAGGVMAVIVPKDRSAGMTAVVYKTSSGAAGRVPLVTVTNLVRALENLKARGVWLVGAAAGSDQSLYDVDLARSTALILGSEDKGLRRLTAEACDYQVHLPMKGAAESLNVSVAAGICIYEAVRQRQ